MDIFQTGFRFIHVVRAHTVVALTLLILRRVAMSVAAQTRTDKKRKVRALLAGGVVLGVGAAVTLAAWTDQEWATGTFAAGSFNIEGSTDGTAFTDHTSEDGAAVLDFQIGADNLSPTDIVAAPFVLRTDAETSYSATVALTSASGDGDAAGDLTYGIVQVADVGACTPEATGTQIVPAQTGLDSIAGAAEFALEAGTGGAAGAPVTLCLQVTAGEDLDQGETGTALWEFTATSDE
jgi:predicted ribosomally synthesized peptide with SipW-like signal peptide